MNYLAPNISSVEAEKLLCNIPIIHSFIHSIIFYGASTMCRYGTAKDLAVDKNSHSGLLHSNRKKR